MVLRSLSAVWLIQSHSVSAADPRRVRAAGRRVCSLLSRTANARALYWCVSYVGVEKGASIRGMESFLGEHSAGETAHRACDEPYLEW